ncbi:MAG: PQQ-dependent sugar dehydrogenase [Longimicrobiales bacterium]|nr:PQQ-dependent sugar dehydrogenase [Longimicrobiales bacterium]
MRTSSNVIPTTDSVLVGVVLLIATLLTSLEVGAQTTGDPFPEPIPVEAGAISVAVSEFVRLPETDGEPARAMHLVVEEGTDRIFVLEMTGPLYAMAPDGSGLVEYIDVDDPAWGVSVESGGRERGIQSFAFHPDFATENAPGYGRFYIWTDTDNTAPSPDFGPRDGSDSHDTVLLEFVASDATAARYDGGPPRELMRFQQPYGNHNGGQIAFNPLAEPGDDDYGLLHIGVADGGSGGDPQDLAQDLGSAFGKLLRIDPIGSAGRVGEYGVPASNPFVGRAGALPEIWAWGLRNPQRFAWDAVTGALFVTDIGQNTVEEVSVVTAGANLGWNRWEGSFAYVGREGVSTAAPRSESGVTYPVAEYDQEDPLFTQRVAVTGLVVQRSGAIPALEGRVLWGELASGEIFHFPLDPLPSGGQRSLRRLLLDAGDGPTTLLELVRAENARQGREPASRTDLRMSPGPGGSIFLLNKHDGVVRVIGEPVAR